MHISKTVSGLNHLLDFERENGLKIGFVPTMGALHAGHISLIKKALAENDKVVCSIFVNPTQFNDPKDLQQYPRMPENDMSMLQDAGCDIVFLPDVEEIYSAGEALLAIDLGHLETTLEGFYRPGHFKGVATVVDKLFRIVKPEKAYFGEKDFQQLVVIRRLVQLLSYPIDVIGCQTLREPDGLAMSSRNLLLLPEQRKAAPLIFKTITDAGRLLQQISFSAVKNWVTETLNANSFLKVQYFDIVHPETLISLPDYEHAGEARGCIAVLTEGPRLIDNVAYQI